MTERFGPALWLAPVGVGLAASGLILVLGMRGFTAGEVAGVILPNAHGLSGVADLVAVDANLSLVDSAWGGRLLFVVSQDPEFAQNARAAGALWVFDAGAVGCLQGAG